MRVINSKGKWYVVERVGATAIAILVKLHEVSLKGYRLDELDYAEPAGRLKFKIAGRVVHTKPPVEVAIACAYCGATVGEPCMSIDGKPLRYSHSRRGKPSSLG